MLFYRSDFNTQFFLKNCFCFHIARPKSGRQGGGEGGRGALIHVISRHTVEKRLVNLAKCVDDCYLLRSPPHVSPLYFVKDF